MNRAVTIAFVIVCGCATDVDVTDVKLALVEDGLTCVTAGIVSVNSITVDGIGEANGVPCLLATRCIAAPNSTSVAMVDQDLVAASQPLLDVDASRLVEIRIAGHALDSCPDARTMCGSADISAAASGALTIAMTCDSLVSVDHCSDQALPACP